MSNITYPYMEEYLRNLIDDSTGILEEMEGYAQTNNVPIAQKETINFLKTMIAIKKPLRILELGTAIGYSAIEMNSVFDSEIVSIERNEEIISVAEEFINRAGLSSKIKIIPGDCLEVLENLYEEFDMIFMDAGKGHYNKFFPHCLRLLSKDGIIISDNVLFRGMIANDDLVIRRKITIVKRMRKFLEEISKNNELYTTIIPMGDGIAVTTRRR